MSTPQVQPVRSSSPPSNTTTAFQSTKRVFDDASRGNISPTQLGSPVLTAANVGEVPITDVDGQKQDYIENFAAAEDFGPLTKSDNEPDPSSTFERALSMTPELDAEGDMASDPEENDDPLLDSGSDTNWDSAECRCDDQYCEPCLVYLLNPRTPQNVPLHRRNETFDLYNCILVHSNERMTKHVNDDSEVHQDPGDWRSSEWNATMTKGYQRYQVLKENLKAKEELAREQAANFEERMAMISGSSGRV